jgi:hypothetical protein
MVPITSPDKYFSDSIQEGPLAATLLHPASLPTDTLSSGAGLGLISDNEDEPLPSHLPNMPGEILMSDSEVRGVPYANQSNCIPPSTPLTVTGIDHI